MNKKNDCGSDLTMETGNTVTEIIIILSRQVYTTRATLGRLMFPDDFSCWCLEDTVRAEGIKVKKETAIPGSREGIIYKVNLSFSGRFQRIMPMIYTEGNGYELIANDISFKGIRFHGGNTHLNTEGCPLVAYNKINDYTIQGTAEKEVTSKIKKLLQNGNVFLKVINLSQK